MFDRRPSLGVEEAGSPRATQTRLWGERGQVRGQEKACAVSSWAAGLRRCPLASVRSTAPGSQQVLNSSWLEL